MPRVEIPVFTLTPSGIVVTSGANETAGDVANGHYFQNDPDGCTALFVRNSDGSTRNVTVLPAPPAGATMATNVAVSLATGAARWMGRFPLGEWSQATDGDRVYVNVDHAGLRLRAVRFPSASPLALNLPAHSGSRVLVAQTAITLPSVDAGSGGQTNGDAVNGHRVEPFNRGVAIWASNEGAGARWVEFVYYPTPGGQAVTPLRTSLTAGTRMLFGGLFEPWFAQLGDGGRLYVNVEHAEVKLKSFRMAA